MNKRIEELVAEFYAKVKAEVPAGIGTAVRLEVGPDVADRCFYQEDLPDADEAPPQDTHGMVDYHNMRLELAHAGEDEAPVQHLDPHSHIGAWFMHIAHDHPTQWPEPPSFMVQDRYRHPELFGIKPGVWFADDAEQGDPVFVRPDACECGTHKSTGAPRGSLHSSWCPWSKETS